MKLPSSARHAPVKVLAGITGFWVFVHALHGITVMSGAGVGLRNEEPSRARMPTTNPITKIPSLPVSFVPMMFSSNCFCLSSVVGYWFVLQADWPLKEYFIMEGLNPTRNYLLGIRAAFSCHIWASQCKAGWESHNRGRILLWVHRLAVPGLP